jgi:predicted dinucleotide-binding enzyme
MVTLIEVLIGKGHQVAIYDRDVSLGRLHGANRVYIDQTIPHISSLMKASIDAAIDESDVIVVAKRAPEFDEPLRRIGNDKIIIDLVKALPRRSAQDGHGYEGICW